MGKTVEQFIDRHGKWQPGLEELRPLVLATGLDETIEWDNRYTL